MSTTSPTLGMRLYRYFFFRLPVYLAVIMVGYVLSIGPMFWYWHEATFMGNGSSYITQVYYPLAYLCSNNEYVAAAIDWYVNLWIL